MNHVVHRVCTLRATARAGPTRVGTTVGSCGPCTSCATREARGGLSSPEGRKATGHVTGRGEGRNRTHARAGPEWEESPDRTNRLWGRFVRAGAALMAGRRGAPLLHMAVCGVAQAQ